ncbi:MAG: hypothetical protein LBV76_05920 [Deltaproteobacteria bacterium]|jgi:succinylglutamate desuccinylase|nr:hypothetical protein [Deltaproteobacteria bacterium]
MKKQMIAAEPGKVEKHYASRTILAMGMVVVLAMPAWAQQNDEPDYQQINQTMQKILDEPDKDKRQEMWIKYQQEMSVDCTTSCGGTSK